MEGADSCIIVGTRKSLPKVFIASESESDSGGLRHRYSSGSSSLGSSSGSPNTPPSSTSTPHGKATLPQRFGVPGCINTGYGSFQPTSYTDAYVPPLSLDRDRFCGYQIELPHQNKSDEVIKIDSGYGRSSYDSYFMSRRNLSFSTSSSPSLWDSLVTSPIQNIRQKMRGRPSYVDEGSSANNSFKVKPQQILAGLIFGLVLVSIVMILIISYKHFNNRQESEKPIEFNLPDEAKAQHNDNDVKVKARSDEGQSLLLKDDVTIEEVEKMREELKAKIISQEFNELKDDEMQERNESKETIIKKEGEFDVANQKTEELTVKRVENVRSKKKSKNTNPLTKSVYENRKSKAKSRPSKADLVNVGDIEDVALDYPDDPTFRGGQKIERTKRDEVEEYQGIGEKFRKFKSSHRLRKFKSNNGDQFRKYTNDNDGGFRKKGSALSGRE